MVSLVEKGLASFHLSENPIPRCRPFEPLALALRTSPLTRNRSFGLSQHVGPRLYGEREIYSPQANNRCNNQNKLVWQAAREEIPI